MKIPDCPSGEHDAIEAVVAGLRRQMEKDYPPGRMRRDAHPKQHGCVQAEVIVAPELPADLRFGAFSQPGRTYRSWVRYSNGFHIVPDLKADTRGMAVKLLDVAGDAFLSDEQGTQDFLAATHDAFFVPNAVEYVGFPSAAGAGFLPTIWFFLSRRLWRGLMAATRSALVPAMNPLAITYFSQTPYSLGPHVIKFQLRPLITGSLGQSLPWSPLFQLKAGLATGALIVGEIVGLTRLAEKLSDLVEEPDFLRRELAKSLQRSDAWYELRVQRQVGEMPIEDATASWDTQASPFQTVALIRIPRQVFCPAYADEARKSAAEEMETLGENISMSPWHALPDHHPLGSINRARRRANKASSDFRHESNHVPPGPPSAADFDRLARMTRLSPGTVDPKPQPPDVHGHSLLGYLYLRRTPLLVAIAFVAFPLVSMTRLGRPFIGGIFDLDPTQLYLTSFVAFGLAFSVMTNWWVITAYAHRRWRVDKRFTVYPIRPRWYFFSSVLAAPTALATLIATDRSTWGPAGWLEWASAWVAGLVGALLVAAAARWLADQLPAIRFVRTMATWLSHHPGLSNGYVDQRAREFLPGQLFALGLAIVFLLLYITLGSMTTGRQQFPALIFLLLLLIGLCWLLSDATFFLDRFRVPALSAIAALVAVTLSTPGAAHYFQLLDGPDPAPISASQVIVAHRRDAPVAKAVIVVAASGGGSQAAVWTARVLTGLEETCRAVRPQCDASGAVRLISGASGGSVAAMYVVASYEDGHLPVNLPPIEDAAAESTQDSLWRSLVYHDIYRPFRAFRTTIDYDDRGLALERRWEDHVGDARLSSWRLDAAAGKRPGVIFNATIGQTGEHVAISTAGSIPRSDPDGQTMGPHAIDFLDIYPGKDVRVVTAARLSATFPIVTPFARDGQRLRNTRLVDGGYSDQYGVVSAVDWLHAALSGNQQSDEQIERVLILQVRSPSPTYPVTLGSPNWRDQFERDQQSIGLLQAAWRGKVPISSVSFELCDEPSISWHISARQRAEIDRQWQGDSAAAERVVDFLRQSESDSRESVTNTPRCAP